jgi:ADP-ribose pyrophosphatase
MRFDEKTVNIKPIFDGKIIKVELHNVELCNGNISTREIVRHKGGVTVIPITEDNEVILVRQFRKPFDEELLEAPAGKLETGEDPELCAIRELKEETGLTADKLSYLTTMYPSPGYTDEKLYIYKAEQLHEGEAALDEDEFLSVERYTFKQALDMIKSGEIKDAKTIIGILMIASEINS